MPDYKIPAEKLRIQVDPKELGLHGKTTKTLPRPKGLEALVGNEDAVSTVRHGLKANCPNAHIIITGEPGVGKSLLTRVLLEDYCKRQPNNHLTDKVILYNFHKKEEPQIAELPKGTAQGFAESIEKTLGLLVTHISAIEQQFIREEKIAMVKYQVAEKVDMANLEKKYPITKIYAKDQNGQPITDGRGQPVYDYDPANQQEITHLQQMLTDLSLLQEQYGVALKQDIAAIKDKKKLEFGKRVQEELQKNVDATYMAHTVLKEYLDGFVEEAVADYDIFLESHQAKAVAMQKLGKLGLLLEPKKKHLDKYRVNVVVDHSKTVGIPFAKIEHPDERTLLGEVKGGYGEQDTPKAPHFRVDIGKLIECDGGIILLDEKFTGLFRYGLGLEQRLLNVLEDRKARVSGNQNPLVTTGYIETNETSARTKIVACMNTPDYLLCQQFFPQLMERFAYKAHFQSRMTNDARHRKQVTSFVATEIRAYNEKNQPVPHFSEDALVALLQDMSREENQSYLTTRLRKVKQLVLSAAELARLENKRHVERKHVRAAREQQDKGSLAYSIEQRLLDPYAREGRRQLLTQGEKIGQINGLSVRGADGHSFGGADLYRIIVKPGERGKGLRFTDIEKIAGLTGPTHDKGFELLKSFYNNLLNELRTAGIVTGLPPGLELDMAVPDSWVGRDGPSATAAQTYAFLSALSGIPLRQQIAVTGAMDPDGGVAIVGGLNEKIEGWYHILGKRGHTGGVMIPYANIQECNLADDVISAIKKGTFTVYYHKNVREGVEVVMGKTWNDVITGIKKTFSTWDTILQEEKARNTPTP